MIIKSQCMDLLPALNPPKTEIAQLLGISRQHLNMILTERTPISPQGAVRLGKRSATPGPWVRMQGAYDTWRAERGVDTAQIPTIKTA